MFCRFDALHHASAMLVLFHSVRSDPMHDNAMDAMDAMKCLGGTPGQRSAGYRGKERHQGL